jgi:hypothetical protein
MQAVFEKKLQSRLLLIPFNFWIVSYNSIYGGANNFLL